MTAGVSPEICSPGNMKPRKHETPETRQLWGLSLRPSASGYGLFIGAAAALVLALAWGCSGGPGSPDRGELKQVQGLVVEVVARNIDEVETLGVRDADGRVWTFTTQGYAGFTPGHLREHQLFGDRVVVYFREEAGSEDSRLVAVRFADARN